MQKSIKNIFRNYKKKAHAYLRTIPKAPVKFQKDTSNTVGGVARIRLILPIHCCGIGAPKKSKLKMQNSNKK